jgi:hypothetical protein
VAHNNFETFINENVVNTNAIYQYEEGSYFQWVAHWVIMQETRGHW